MKQEKKGERGSEVKGWLFVVTTFLLIPVPLAVYFAIFDAAGARSLKYGLETFAICWFLGIAFFFGDNIKDWFNHHIR